MTAESITLSDHDIIRRIMDGDVNAFEYLLKKYQDHVLRITHRHIPLNHVEETAQEVFIRAYQALPTLKDTSRFKSWLSTIAIRTCRDFWRKQYRLKEKAMSELTDRQQDWLVRVSNDRAGQSFHNSWKRREAREVLDWALSRLSSTNRMVMELVYFENHSIQETAERMGLSAANVKVRAFRARKKLHKLLSGLLTPQGRIP